MPFHAMPVGWSIPLVVILTVTAIAQPNVAEQLRVVETHRDPVMERLFTATDGWVGADGAYSVRLSDDRRVWLFSDTFVGKVRDGKRVDCTMVNNSLAVQTGSGEDARIEFIVRQDTAGGPESFLRPTDGRGYFWLQDASFDQGTLWLFLSQMESTPQGGAFGFRQIGTWLGVVRNPHDHPLDWSIEQLRVPHARFAAGLERSFGAAVLSQEGQLYIYGLEIDGRGTPRRDLVLARAPLDHVDDFSQWRFFQDGQWIEQPEELTGLVPGMASEASVTYLSDLKQFVLVSNERGILPSILARAADHPWGPWSDPVVVFQCPESDSERQVFTYAAKGHRILGRDDELLISYATNSFDFRTVVADASLYFPRFVRVKLGVADSISP